jgi:tetratricopeptide (TPR) repeat protein
MKTATPAAIADLKIAVVVLVLLTGIDAGAGVRNIRRANLPSDPAVQSAYDDVAKVESMVQSWSSSWQYATPKEDVIARLGLSLKALQEAAERSPDNGELQLFLGLVAHYSYNLDVQKSYSVAVQSLEKATKMAPQDYRPRWFLGYHQCQSLAIKEGMTRLLAVEQESAWERLPPEFWDDYLNCAHIAYMPAHALRAADHANHLDPQGAQGRQFLVDASHKRIRVPDATSSYEVKEVWESNKAGAWVSFTSPMFGMEFSTPGNWHVSFSGATNGAGNAVVEAGPYPGKTGQVFPNLLVIARPPKPGEGLADFLKAAQTHGSWSKSANPPACPAKECLAVEGALPGAYKKEGDGFATVVVFKREEPSYPGLTFEEPVNLPKTEGDGTHYFVANERIGRLPGTLYYLVMLDTAESVKASAQHAYSDFLKSLRVE